MAFFALLLLGFTPALRAQTAFSGSQPLLNKKNQSEILREADEIFQKISEIRGLKIKGQVKKEFKDKAFFRNYYSHVLQGQYPPEKQKATEKAYVQLGFLAAGSDLVQTYLNSFVKSIRGLYDPETKTLYLADWIGFQDQEETLVHELTHALQDQYFDLNAYEKNGGEVSLDRQFAKDSVVEGEAVALTLNYKLRDKNLDFTQLANIADENQISNVLEEKGRTAFGRPVPVNDVVSFAYIYGASFLQKYVKIYGWQGMGALFAHPPLSTQQVMHPEKYYLKKQVPIHIAIEDMSKGPLSGSKKIWEDSFGEYGLYLVLRQYIPEKRAFQSVKGWRGDALQVYEFPGRDQIVLMGYVVFEDTDSARDFFESYRSRLEGKYNFETIRAEETIHRASVEGTGTEVYVERLGRRVVFLEGTSTSEADKVRNELWNIKKISPQASVKR